MFRACFPEIFSANSDKIEGVSVALYICLRVAAERFHRREKDRVKDELNRISNKLPAVHRIKDFRNKFLYGEAGLDKSLSHSVPDLRAKKIRGVPEERPQMPFCERFFIHHLPNKKKYYKAPTPSPIPFIAVAAEGEVTAEGEGAVLPPLVISGGGDAETAAAQTEVVNGLSSAQFATEEQSLAQEEVSKSAVDAGLPSQRDVSHRTSPNTERGSGNNLRVRNGNHNPRHNNKGGQSDRGSGRTSLPPIHRQSLRLSQSSPQLFQG